MKNFILVSILLVGCGVQEQHTDKRTGPMPQTTEQKQIQDLQTEVLALQGTQAQITAFSQGEYDTCSNVGDGASAFVQQVCKIAKSANADDLVLLKGELGQYSAALSTQIAAVQTSLTAVQTAETADAAAITSINTQITTINSNITTLQTQMVSAQAAITALQTTVNGITVTLNNTLGDVEIGTENFAAGPLYESLVRRTDKTKIMAYVSAAGGRGLGLVWQTSNGADTVVRTTSYGTAYNFIVTAVGLICYDKTVAAQTFAIITANGANIICK